jgi:hypothetical protein
MAGRHFFSKNCPERQANNFRTEAFGGGSGYDSDLGREAVVERKNAITDVGNYESQLVQMDQSLPSPSAAYFAN